MITMTKGALSISAGINGGLFDMTWNGVSYAKYISSRLRLNKITFKRTPTRQPPADMVSFLESLGQTVDFVDVEEDEVP